MYLSSIFRLLVSLRFPLLRVERLRRRIELYLNEGKKKEKKATSRIGKKAKTIVKLVQCDGAFV